MMLISLTSFADDVKTVGIGSGIDKDSATLSALRNALENVYGVYLTSSTTIKDDKIISDDITAVSFGKVLNYKVISSVQESDKNYVVTVEANVSLDKLASFIGENTGTSVKFDGAGWGLQQKLARLNKENEENAARNIVESIKKLDVDLTPSLTIKKIENDKYRSNWSGCGEQRDMCLKLTVKFDKKANPNKKALIELVENSFNALRNPKTKKFLSNETIIYYNQICKYIESRSRAFAIKDVGNGVIYPIKDSNCDHRTVRVEKEVNAVYFGKLYYNSYLGYNWNFKIKKHSPTMGGEYYEDYKTIIIRIFYNEESLEKVTELLIIPL